MLLSATRQCAIAVREPSKLGIYFQERLREPVALPISVAIPNISAAGFAPPKLRQVVTEAVFRRGRIVLGTLLLVVGLTVFATLLMHRKYQSNAKLVVQNVRTAAQLSTSNVDRLVSQGDVSPTEINTEVDLLGSDEVARRALGLKGTLGLGDERDDKAARDLEGRLSVEAVHQTNIIDVKLLANSPAKANADLQHVIDAYFEGRAGTARNSGAAGFFNAQLKTKEEQLNQDQAALTAFQVRNGIADLEEQIKLQVGHIATLGDQLAQAESLLAAQRKRTAMQKAELNGTPARSQTLERTITNQYSQERLNTSLVDLENRRTELLKRYSPNDRQITEISEKMATIRAAVTEASQHPAGEDATDINPLWQQLKLAVVTSGSDISALGGQTTELKRQIAAAKERLNQLEQASTAYGELRRGVQQSQADYTLYAQRRDEARISEALDREKLFNVAVLESPMASPEPVRPKPLLYVIVAFVFAAFLGTALALYADLSGGQVHSPAQLEAITGMRTLATFADGEPGAPLAEGNRLQLQRVLFAVRQATFAQAEELQDEAVMASFAPASRGGNGSLDRSLNGSGHRRLFQESARGGCVALASSLRREGVSYLAGHLAAEAARQTSSRVAVLDMFTLLRRFESGCQGGDEAVHVETHFDPGNRYWVLSGQAEAEADDGVPQGDAQGRFSLWLRPTLERLRGQFDLLVLDCPSLQASTLAAELAPCVDGYLAVVSANAARKQNIEDLIAQMNVTPAPLLGYLLNRRSYPVPRWLYRILW